MLQEGFAEKSYGIPVARLAGIPSSVLNRAEKLLEEHESRAFSFNMKKTADFKTRNKSEIRLQKNSINPLFESLMREMLDYPLMTQSPIDAMNQIQSWQKVIRKLRDSQAVTAVKTSSSDDSEQHSLTEILN